MQAAKRAAACSSVQLQQDTRVRLETSASESVLAATRKSRRAGRDGDIPARKRTPTPTSARGTKPKPTAKACPALVLLTEQHRGHVRPHCSERRLWGSGSAGTCTPGSANTNRSIGQHGRGCRGSLRLPSATAGTTERCQASVTLSSQSDTDHAEISKPELGKCVCR